ncbi:MAG: hypothetical protein WD270_09030, partial [Acetobacterales bacterium]
MSSPHLVVALSSHGYGHAAMTAPVVAALAARIPTLDVSLVSTLPEAWLRQRFPSVGAVVGEDLDVGLAMASPLDVDREASYSAYRRFHEEWDRRLAAASSRIIGLAPDLVLSNVGYLPLAVAAHAGVPSVALSSLNWLSVFRAYFGDRAGAAAIMERMRQAYAAAELFIRCTPALPMEELANTVAIGPIAERGMDRHAEIVARLGLASDTRLLLLSLGGRYPSPASVKALPAIENAHWLLPPDWPVVRADMSRSGALDDFRFADIVRSSAALVTKPGYGLVTEAACAGTPVLCVRRGDWPEEPGMVQWLHDSGRCIEITRDRFDRGDFACDLRELAGGPRPAAVAPS